MPSRFHPQLINDPFGDPGLYVEFMFERRAVLFDLGDLGPFSTRKLLRVSDVFVSHMHMDHFAGFDRLLRLSLGRERRLRLYGPEGLIAAVGHKLSAYTWNLVDGYEGTLTLEVAELQDGERLRTVEFRSATGFAREAERVSRQEGDRLLAEESFCVRAATLDHGIPCLAFALEEPAHVSVWKNRVEEMGLRVGPWLKRLKSAMLRGDPDDTPIKAEGADGAERTFPLGALRGTAATFTAGMKVAYAVDAAPTEENCARIAALARGADVLYIEAAFLHADLALARRRRHLTARLAGEIARAAAVERLVTLHHSPRYEGRGDEFLREAARAFEGRG
jgi:ribonuclease Z